MDSFLGLATGVCNPCSADAFCATCQFSESQCTSCLDGYSLNLMKCISDSNLGVSMTLNADFNTFMANIISFKLSICRMLGGSFVGKEKLFTILSLVFGSVEVDGSVTVPEGEDATSAFDSLSSSL